MKLLLDTHALLWMFMAPEKLGEVARPLLVDPANDVWVSIVALWEIHLKLSTGKLELATGWRESLEHQMIFNQVRWLAIESKHCAGIEVLPWLHRDPFDRMILAQARMEKMILLSRDEKMAAYDVDCRW